MLCPFLGALGSQPHRNLQQPALFRGRPLQTLNHQPAAFVVLDVRADLARHSGVPKEVEVIVLGRGQRRTCEEAPRRAPEPLPPSPGLPTWIWKNSPICSRISLASACCFSPSMPAYGENGTSKPRTGDLRFPCGISRGPQYGPPHPLPSLFRRPWLRPEDLLVLRPLGRLFQRGPPVCALRREAGACPAQLSLPAPAWTEWELGEERPRRAGRPATGLCTRSSSAQCETSPIPTRWRALCSPKAGGPLAYPGLRWPSQKS